MATANAKVVVKEEIVGVTLDLSLHEARFLYSIYNMIGCPGSESDGALLSVYKALKNAGVTILESSDRVWDGISYPSLSKEFSRLADLEAKD